MLDNTMVFRAGAGLILLLPQVNTTRSIMSKTHPLNRILVNLRKTVYLCTFYVVVDILYYNIIANVYKYNK